MIDTTPAAPPFALPRSRPGGVGGTRLRLVPAPADAAGPRRAGPRPAAPTPVTQTYDPRWVVAVRVAELMQGTAVSPPARDQIVQFARRLRLTPFDAQLIIAIVQDQARRGHAPALCPAAGEPQLRMVPLPPRRGLRLRPTSIRTWALVTAGLLAEAGLLMWWLM